MTEPDMIDQILDVVVKLAPSQDAEASTQSRLVADLGFHSLALLELAVELEELFDLPPLDSAATTEINTVADIVRLVADRLTAGEERERGDVATPMDD